MTNSSFLTLTGSTLISAIRDVWTTQALLKLKTILEDNWQFKYSS